VLSIAKPAFCGLGLYQSYRYSRALTVGWDEQRMLCTMDHIASITMLVLTSSDNLKFLCGEKFANRVWYGSFSAYAVMPGLYYLTKRVEESRVNETQFLKWEQEFPKNGDEDERTLGTRIEESLDSVGGRRDWFEEKCPEQGEEDVRPLAQRIDEAHVQSERSGLEKTFHDVVNFSYMHIADAVLLISAVQSVAAIYFGFNQIGNMIQTLFCALAVAEQGTFWMKPEEDAGPLFKINEGAIVRAYEPTMVQLNLTVGVAFNFFYKGIPGKINAIMSLVARFAPHLIRNNLPDAGERSSCGFEATPEHIVGREVINSWGLTPTEKHFEVFSIEDQFSSRNLTEMELELQTKIIEDHSPFMEEVTDISNGLTNREKLEFILGKEGAKGYFHRHVISSRTDKEMRTKEMELKNVFGALLKDWELIKSRVVSYHGDLKCRTATGRAMNDLCLEVYPEISGKQPVGHALLEPKQALKNRLEQKVALILQQLRDRQFQLFLQGIIMEGEKLRGDKAEQRKAQDKAERFERERCYNQIKDLSQITTALWWTNLKEYLFVSGKQLGWHLLTEVLHSTAMSRHQINSNTVLFAGNLGLSSYQEARRDIQMMLAKQLLDIQILDMVAPMYANQLDPQIKGQYRQEYRAELMEAIQEEADTRLDYEEIRDYMLLRAKDFGKKDALVVEYQDFEQYKPVFVQTSPGQYEEMGDAEAYKKGRADFVNRYLDQVLLDVGLLA